MSRSRRRVFEKEAPRAGLRTGVSVTRVAIMRFNDRVKSSRSPHIIHTALLAAACALGLSSFGCDTTVCSVSCQQGFMPSGCACVPVADAGVDTSDGG
jgi:hypothetical protein